MANAHECLKTCFACNRPSDTFRHVHIPAGDRAKNDLIDEIVFCVPCLSELMQGLYPTINAYLNGGRAFDDYARTHRGPSRGRASTPLPSWVLDVLKEMTGDDAAATGDDPRD